jgi:hypothetical protein
MKGLEALVAHVTDGGDDSVRIIPIGEIDVADLPIL